MRSVTALCWACSAGRRPLAAEDLRRATVWDLRLGQPVSAQPASEPISRLRLRRRTAAPPRRQLSGWADFRALRCGSERTARGLFRIRRRIRIHRARQDLPREVSRWAGTTEAGFPVVVSALFDDDGVLKGIRVVTDPAPSTAMTSPTPICASARTPICFGGLMAARHGIDAARDCVSLPAAEGEAPSATLFVKQSCELTDAPRGRKIVVRANYFRKTGQSGVNPQLPTQLTQGQFESSARLEISVSPP